MTEVKENALDLLRAGMPQVPEMVAREAIEAIDEKAVATKTAQDLGLLDFNSPEKSAGVLMKSAPVLAAVDQYVGKLVDIDWNDSAASGDALRMAQTMGLETQRTAAMKNDIMKRQLRQLGAAEGGNKELREEMVALLQLSNELDPSGVDFSVNGLLKALGWVLPKRLTDPIAAYFLQYEAAEVAIDQLLKNLDRGWERLRDNNATILAEEAEIRKLTVRLLHVAALGMALCERVEAKIATLPEGETKSFLKQQVLFELNTRVKSILKQLTVNQQGYMAMELARQVNDQLARAVQDTRNVTVSALNIAIFLAFIIHDQKMTLDVIEALDAKANELMMSNARMLRQNMGDIMKRIVHGGLQFEAIQGAMTEVKGAIEDYERLREEALAPQKEQLAALFGLAEDAEKSIQKIERGNVAKEQMIDLSADAFAA